MRNWLLSGATLLLAPGDINRSESFKCAARR